MSDLLTVASIATGVTGILAAFAALLLYLVDVARAERRAHRDPWQAAEARPATRGERYPGCIVCEGAEAVGLDALARHQARDHRAGRAA